MEQEVKMSDIQLKETRITFDSNIQEIRRMNQQIEAWNKDIADDVQNAKLRLEIRKLGLNVDKLEQENKVYQKRIRTGKELVDKGVTIEDLNKFDKAKAAEGAK